MEVDIPVRTVQGLVGGTMSLCGVTVPVLLNKFSCIFLRLLPISNRVTGYVCLLFLLHEFVIGLYKIL